MLKKHIPNQLIVRWTSFLVPDEYNTEIKFILNKKGNKSLYEPRFLFTRSIYPVGEWGNCPYFGHSITMTGITDTYFAEFRDFFITWIQYS